MCYSPLCYHHSLVLLLSRDIWPWSFEGLGPSTQILAWPCSSWETAADASIIILPRVSSTAEFTGSHWNSGGQSGVWCPSTSMFQVRRKWVWNWILQISKCCNMLVPTIAVCSSTCSKCFGKEGLLGGAKCVSWKVWEELKRHRSNGGGCPLALTCLTHPLSKSA